MIGFPKIRFKFFIIISIIFISGCQENGNASSPHLSNKTSPSPPSTEAPSQTPTPTPGFTPTLTLTPTITPSPTNTITPSWTSVPTLPLEEALDAVDQIYQDNGGCELPCVWGVSPGETPWEEVRDRFSPLGTIWWKEEYPPGMEWYTFWSAFPPGVNQHEFGYFEIYFYTDKAGHTIEAIAISGQDISPDFDPRLSSILDAFGAPDLIWMTITTGFIQGNSVSDAYYILDLFYSDQGYLISYVDDALIAGRTLRICPSRNILRDLPNPSFFIYSKDFANLVREVFIPRIIGDVPLLEDYQDVMNTTSFYETYLDPETKVCIEVDLDTAYRLEVHK